MIAGVAGVGMVSVGKGVKYSLTADFPNLFPLCRKFTEGFFYFRKKGKRITGARSHAMYCKLQYETMDIDEQSPPHGESSWEKRFLSKSSGRLSSGAKIRCTGRPTVAML